MGFLDAVYRPSIGDEFTYYIGIEFGMKI